MIFLLYFYDIYKYGELGLEFQIAVGSCGLATL